MVEFRIKVHPKQQTAYFPKEIVEALGLQLKAKPNRYAMVVYPENADTELVIKSLEVLLADLKLEKEAKS